MGVRFGGGGGKVRFCGEASVEDGDVVVDVGGVGFWAVAGHGGRDRAVIKG